MQAQTENKTTTNLVQVLRNLAAKDSVFKEVMMTFAMRDRARRQVTLARLMYTMEQEKYQFTRDQLTKVLEQLAKAGVGAIKKNSKGEIDALINVKYTLQTVGKAALSEEGVIKSFNPQERMKSIRLEPAQKSVEQKIKEHKELTEKEFESNSEADKCKITIKAEVNGKSIDFYTGARLSKSEIVDLIANLNAHQ